MSYHLSFPVVQSTKVFFIIVLIFFVIVFAKANDTIFKRHGEINN